MIAAPQARDAVISSLQAFTAGFVNSCGFVALASLFTAHVTGNFVVIGAGLLDHRSGLTTKLLALPVFIAAVIATRLFEHGFERRERSPARALIALQTFGLLIFMGVGEAASPLTSPDNLLAVMTGLAAVAAMAVQNAASRSVFTGLAPTTVMTGNVTQLTIDLVDLATGHRPHLEASVHARVRKMWPPVLSFSIGAGLGAFGYAALGFSCLLAPIGALMTALAFVRGPAR